jgi:hypothetical protein
MPKNLYIEDLFIDFYDAVTWGNITIQEQDKSACNSFYTAIETEKMLTEKQSRYLLRILSKYQSQAELLNLDYGTLIQTLAWKHPFRVVDDTKSVAVEKDEQKTLWLVFRMPYALKEKLDALLQKNTQQFHSAWDPDRQVRKIKLYSCNLMQINDFVTEHGFFKDETFLTALAAVEQIWQDQEQAVPQSIIVKDQVELLNAPEDAKSWWDNNRQKIIDYDIFLAKSMGYPVSLDKLPETLIEKISSSTATSFWIKSIADALEIYKKSQGKLAVVVNKDQESFDWIRKFTDEAEKHIDSSDIKICFRLEKNEDNHNFNEWVKHSGYGGSIESGRVFIFQGKPAKWLFSADHDVKLIVTNSLYPIPSSLTQDWMATHPCVLYVGDQKASHIKDKNIVNL